MIRVTDVTHDYGAERALDGVSFDVRAGEIAGFLGPNGAGKSTLFKLLSTYLPVQSGSIELAGFDVVKAPLEVRARIGYLPEHNPLFDGMRVDRFLAFVGAAHGLDGAELAARAEWVVERCDLRSVLTKHVRECSKGFRQRIGLAAALIHDPPVLLLDEPTHGLDPLQVASFRAFVRELAPGRAILFSSHVLAEVAAISDRILLLVRGRLVLDLPLAELEARARARRATLEDLVLEAVRDSAASDSLVREGGVP
ncbi:MAG: ATP-binding cassette domain-containing protein [Planctomycetes bacterium]|nr:ATP-binding cassette domain-containing protein [Planctomycetota bacterium]